MKRFYMALAIVAGLATGAKAQNADLEGAIVMRDSTCLSNGATIQSDSTVTPYGIFGIINNGPESLLSGDQVNFVFPRARFTTTDINVYPYVLTANAAANSVVFSFSNEPVDSTNSLIDIAIWENGGTLGDALVARSNFVTGKIYGYYVWVLGAGTDVNNPDNTDGEPGNNFVYVPIKWNGCATSIGDLIKGAKTQAIDVYPNPAADQINFKLDIEKSTNVTARVYDLTGRTLVVKDFGKISMGANTFNMNVSALPKGTYMVEVNANDSRSISKFTIK